MLTFVIGALTNLIPVIVTAETFVAPAERAVYTTGGPLYGPNGSADCGDIKVIGGSDWLPAAACALSKCQHDWVAKNLKITAGDVNSASSVSVTTWDRNFGQHVTTVSYTDSEDDGEDNNVQAWFMGAVNVAVAKVGDVDLEAGTLTTDNDDFEKNAAAYGLTFLTGQKAITETVPSDDDTFWNDMIVHANSSPVIVRGASECTSVLAGQNYVVYNFNSTAKEVILWDVRAVDTFAIDVPTLRGCSDYLYHLDNYAPFTG